MQKQIFIIFLLLFAHTIAIGFCQVHDPDSSSNFTETKNTLIEEEQEITTAINDTINSMANSKIAVLLNLKEELATCLIKPDDTYQILQKKADRFKKINKQFKNAQLKNMNEFWETLIDKGVPADLSKVVRMYKNYLDTDNSYYIDPKNKLAKKVPSTITPRDWLDLAKQNQKFAKTMNRSDWTKINLEPSGVIVGLRLKD